MNRNKFVGLMFLVLGISSMLRAVHIINYAKIGIVMWSLFVLDLGIKKLKKKAFDISACVMIAVSLGLLMDQITFLNKFSESSYITPFVLIAISVSYIFRRNSRMSNIK